MKKNWIGDMLLPGQLEIERSGGRQGNQAKLRKILNAAARCFYQKGFRGTSVEEIARETGILKGSLYHYIEKKEDLLFALVHGVITQGATKVIRACEGLDDPALRLKCALEVHLEHVFLNQVRVGLFFHEYKLLGGKQRKQLMEELNRYQQLFETIIRDGQDSRQFVSGDPSLLTYAILGPCNWICRWHRLAKTPGLPEIRLVFVSFLLRGIYQTAEVTKGTNDSHTEEGRDYGPSRENRSRRHVASTVLICSK